MTPITWTTTEADHAALQGWARRLVARKSLAWLLPYSATITVVGLAGALAGRHAIWVGALAGGMVWRELLDRLWRKEIRSFEPNTIGLDQSGIHTVLSTDPSCANRYAWAGVGETKEVRGGTVVDAGYGAWLFVPDRATTAARLRELREARASMEVDVPEGHADWRLTYRVGRTLLRPVMQPPVVKAPMPLAQRVMLQLLGVALVFFVTLGWRYGHSWAAHAGWALFGAALSGLALVVWISVAQRQRGYLPTDRQLGIGEWRFAAGERGFWLGSATATMTLGWASIAGAHRDDDRVILRLRKGFRALPAAAFANDAEIERFVAYVGAHAAPRVEAGTPAADAGPFAAPPR